MKLEKKLKEIISHEYNSPYYDKQDQRKIDMIILHTTHETFKSYDLTGIKDDINVYTDKENPIADRELSPHFLISEYPKVVDGKPYTIIFQMVELEKIAHHAGTSHWKGEERLNRNSIGIEIRGYTNKKLFEEQYNSINLLVQYLVEEYNIPINRILGHYQVAPDRRSDPGGDIMNSVKEEQIRRLHESALIIDGHQDTIYSIMENGKDIRKRSNFDEVDIPRMREGKLDIAMFALHVEKAYKSFKASKRLRQLLNCFEETIRFKALKQIRTIKDIKNLGKRVGIILSMEGADGLGAINSLKFLYDKGVRCMSLTHNWKNMYVTGVESRSKEGLTRKGERVIKEMEDLGIILDVSHLNEKSFWDVVKIAKKPLVASHSNCYGIKRHRRNLKDKQIKAIAETGGVIGINFWTKLLESKIVKGVVDNIDYIKELVGIDYVSIGSDFDGIDGKTPKGLEDVSKLENLTKELVRRGYNNNEIRKVLGLNYLRVFKEVWN